MNLGETIYRLRTERNMSQGDLAETLEVSRQSISKTAPRGRFRCVGGLFLQRLKGKMMGISVLFFLLPPARYSTQN